MLIYYTDHFVLPLPPGHRFPMRKYAALRERVAAVARRSDARAGGGDRRGARARPRSRVHRGRLRRHARRARDETHRLSVVAGDGRALAALRRRDDRRLPQRARIRLRRQSRGRHAPRASRLRRRLLRVQRRRRRGARDAGGSARRARADRRPRRPPGRRHRRRSSPATTSVFTFSMHGRNNFPFRKRGSDLDVELDDGTGDGAYLAALAVALPRALGAIAAGSRDLSRRRRSLLRRPARPARADQGGPGGARPATCCRRCASAGVPVAIAMAGGYADDIDDIVDIHFATVALALELWGRDDAAETVRRKPRIRARLTA